MPAQPQPKDSWSPREWASADQIAFAASMLVSLAFVVPVLYRGWVPFDEGWMMEQALRVRDGQLPHRDFTDLWTGGWSFVHAALLSVFGVSMAVMRTAILAAWTAGLVMLYRSVRAWAGPAVSGMSVVVASLWTLWAWQLPLLNWLYAPGALLVFLLMTGSSRRGEWWRLPAAGAVSGALFSLKITGLYLLAALLLAGLSAAAGESRTAGSTSAPRRLDGRWIGVLLCGTYAALSVRLVSGMPGAESAVVLIGGPNVLLAVAICLALWRGGPIDGLVFFRAVAFRTALLVAGFAVPLALLLAPYILSHSVGDFMRGVFEVPLARMSTTAFPPPWWRLSVKFALPSLLLWFGVPRALWNDSSRTAWIAVGMGLAFGATLALLPSGPPYLLPMLSTVPLAVTGAFCWSLFREGTGPRTHDVVLLVALAATAQLIQVPFATVNYFLASAPLLLAAAVAVTARPGRRAPVLFCLATFAAAGALGARRIPVTNLDIKLWGSTRVPSGDAIWVPREDSVRFAEVSASVLRHRGSGGLFVFPLHNELYYFTGTRNPTRHVTPLLATESELESRALIAQLDAARTTVVVLFPAGSDEWPLAWRAVQRDLRGAYTCGETVRRWAEIRWRPLATGRCQ